MEEQTILDDLRPPHVETVSTVTRLAVAPQTPGTKVHGESGG